MLLTIETTRPPDGPPASDLGYLLHKHPDRVQRFSLNFGEAHVFYPLASDERCRVALLVELDRVGLAKRGPRDGAVGLEGYVHDRAYVASSHLSVALNRVFRSAINGQCTHRPELVDTAWPTTARLPQVAWWGDAQPLVELFEPLGYAVTAQRGPLDEQHPEWGDSPYVALTLKASLPVRRLLQHLYVLMPVLDNAKHYWVGREEVDKLLAKGGAMEEADAAGGWLRSHPKRSWITRRYLRSQAALTNDALQRLREGDPEADATDAADAEEAAIEKPISLHQQRIDAVVAVIVERGGGVVLDLGCGEGRLVRRLMGEASVKHIVGVDVFHDILLRAARRMKLQQPRRALADRRDRHADGKPTPPGAVAVGGKVTLLHGSLMYRDDRLRPGGMAADIATLVEVVEHLDPPRLAAMQRSVFAFAQPRCVILTTPNREYNVRWPEMPAGALRHRDHRFEWTRDEFAAWSDAVAHEHGYSVERRPLGEVDDEVGPPSQMAIFTRQ